MKPKYSDPKLYTGGVDISRWSKLSKNEQKKSLEADWYVYFSFQDPVTGSLKRQPNIKAGVNRLKTKKERLEFLMVMRNNLSILLESGFNPYEINTDLKEEFSENFSSIKSVKNESSKNTNNQIPPPKKIVQIKDALKLCLDIKVKTLAESSYPKFRSRINQFRKWLIANGFSESDNILKINKKVLIEYLNNVLQNTSARNRNNTRTDLGSLFQVLEDNDVIDENFVKKINVLKTSPTRNKTYTPVQESEILGYIETMDTTLLLFVKFVSYNYLRPIEVCRLKIGDVDITDKKLYFRAKNKPVKIKIIPDILLNEMPDISQFPKDNYLFTPNGFGLEWETSDTNKRDYFSKQFKRVKDHFGLGTDYGLYSFRHTFITKLYRELVKSMTPYEAKSKLMLITGHTTMVALEAYLRDIDAVLPEDYSEYLT